MMQEITIMTRLKEVLANMTPEEAAEGIAAAASEVFPLLSDEQRIKIITGMTGGPDTDKVSSMVHL